MMQLAETQASETSRKNLPLCVLDDESDQIELMTSRLARAGFPAVGTKDANEALQMVRRGVCHAVIADNQMPEMDGWKFLENALHSDPGMYVILANGCYSVESAIEAIKRGAYDYLCKPIDFARLLKTLDDLAQVFTQRGHIRNLDEQILSSLEFHGIIGKSPAMLEMFDLARKVARHYRNVLITGPTGSGKELVAQALQKMSPVAHERFAVCNCSALVDTLLESQLFGHVRGAFAGATDSRPGLFEYANGGTLFLDEIGETSLAMQAKLLRAVESREIQRVGSPEIKEVNVRLIAASNRDLRAEVQAKRFREDLFFRLSAIELRVPSLAERPEDIPILVRHFLKKYGESYGKSVRGLTRRAQVLLLQHDWPGNVRELENVLSSAAMSATNEFIDVQDLSTSLQHPRGQGHGLEANWRPLPLEEVRRIHIDRVLESCKGNRVRAAHMLGIGRTSLYRHLKRTNKRAVAASSAAN
ncbi:MAG TPA: sigma-54 dependent transcriptional regulator [Candidatus Acidoferrales bacterium]